MINKEMTNMNKKGQKIAVWLMIIIMVISVVGAFIAPLLAR